MTSPSGGHCSQHRRQTSHVVQRELTGKREREPLAQSTVLRSAAGGSGDSLVALYDKFGFPLAQSRTPKLQATAGLVSVLLYSFVTECMRASDFSMLAQCRSKLDTVVFGQKLRDPVNEDAHLA
jgi:hypothetical protein